MSFPKQNVVCGCLYFTLQNITLFCQMNEMFHNKSPHSGSSVIAFNSHVCQPRPDAGKLQSSLVLMSLLVNSGLCWCLFLKWAH